MLGRATIAVSLLATLLAAPAMAITRTVCGDATATCAHSMGHARSSPLPAFECCHLRTDAPLGPALFERTASVVAMPAAVSLAVLPVPLGKRDIARPPSPAAVAAGPPLFLKLRALLI